MKVLVLNGSPKENSNTMMLTTAFMEGLNAETWSVPVVEYIVKEKNKLYEILLLAVKRINEESQNKKPYYGGLWKTEVIKFDED